MVAAILPSFMQLHSWLHKPGISSMDLSRPPSVDAAVERNRVALNEEPRSSGMQERLAAMVHVVAPATRRGPVS